MPNRDGEVSAQGQPEGQRAVEMEESAAVARVAVAAVAEGVVAVMPLIRMDSEESGGLQVEPVGLGLSGNAGLGGGIGLGQGGDLAMFLESSCCRRSSAKGGRAPQKSLKPCTVLCLNPP